MLTLVSCGVNSLTIAVKRGLIVHFLEMNRRLRVASLSDRLMRSLILSGLIAGIIPTSMRRLSGQLMLDFALSPQDGGDAERQNQKSF